MLKRIFMLIALAVCLSGNMLRGQNNTSGIDKNIIPEAYTRSVDSMAYYLDAHFRTEEEKLRALYTWIVANMRYNVYPTFVSNNEVPDDEKEIREALRAREGVCRQFSMIFEAVATRLDIPVYIVYGYNKNNGVLMPEPHQWCAAKVGREWFLYDPTYGMGYVVNYQFVSAPNMNYCKVKPQDLIRTHMPFDPMWQLLEKPYTYAAFDQSKEAQAVYRGPAFQYNDSIVAFDNMPRLKQLLTISNRMSNNGPGNRLVDYYYQLTQSNIKVHRQNEVYNIYKKAVKYQNQGADSLNNFVWHRRMKFKPRKDEALIRLWISTAERSAAMADSVINLATDIPRQYETAVRNLRNSIIELKVKVELQKAFMEQYYAAPKSRRDKLFQQ
ncbi:MAG: hypothetical protein IJ511_04400 [Bacteroides sp.]|nr:hypothetical protein [Bacteroides sp.]